MLQCDVIVWFTKINDGRILSLNFLSDMLGMGMYTHTITKRVLNMQESLSGNQKLEWTGLIEKEKKERRLVKFKENKETPLLFYLKNISVIILHQLYYKNPTIRPTLGSI